MTSVVFLHCSPSCILRQGLSVNPESPQTQLNQPASKPPGLLLSPPQRWNYRHATMPDFSMDAEALNSSPHARSASNLPAKPPLHLVL